MFWWKNHTECKFIYSGKHNDKVNIAFEWQQKHLGVLNKNININLGHIFLQSLDLLLKQYIVYLMPGTWASTEHFMIATDFLSAFTDT